MNVDLPPPSVNVNGVDVPLPPLDQPCYDAQIGKRSIEWEAMGVIASAVQNTFCVDKNRLFVAGFGRGATLSNMFGCYFAGRDPTRAFGEDISVRGQATVTGGPAQPDVPCGGNVAAIWIHDTDDSENPIAGNSMTSLPRVLAVDNCAGGVDGPRAP